MSGLHLPQFVTLTGVDERTSVNRMLSLSKRYPVEWGVLMSPTRAGTSNRFMSLAGVRAAKSLGLRLAAHLCGGYSREIARGTFRFDDDVVEVLEGGFERYQINTTEKDPEVPNRVSGFVTSVGKRHARGILQTRDGFPADPRVQWLFDQSGGRGTVPDTWPTAPGSLEPVGYAGGLGPDNVQAAILAMQATHNEHRPYWIDMETQIRTDDWLDLDKCEAVLRAVYPHRAAEGDDE